LSRKRLCVIDGDSLIYIHSWKNKESNNLDDYLSTMRSHIEEILQSTHCEKYIGFLTISRRARKDIIKDREYKKGRAKDKPKFFYELRNYLRDEFGFYYHDYYEADDMCKYSYDILKNAYNIVIASPDKDLKQFACEFYDYNKMVGETITEEKAAYNLWYQVLIGDTTDNILGLRGVGPVKASKILDNLHPEEMPIKVFSEYINVLGLREGVKSLSENIQLVLLFGNPPVVLPDDLKINNLIKEFKFTQDSW